MAKVYLENKNLKNRMVFESKKGRLKNPLIMNCINSKYNSISEGTTKYIDLSELKTVILLDIPLILPLEDKKRHDIMLGNKKYKVYHYVKEAGMENFNNINAELLGKFSSFKIITDAIHVNEGEKLLITKEKVELKNIIRSLLEKILRAINSGEKYKLNLLYDCVSYELHYYQKSKDSFSTQPDFSFYCFYDGIIEIKGDEYKLEKDEYVKLKSDLLKEQFELETYLHNYKFSNGSFIESVNELVHAFLYHCSQRSRAMSKLNEEEIRDLLLLSFGIRFGNAEGEAYNFDGKTDFKVKDPKNVFSNIIGELKKWAGISSFNEVFQQGTIKHCTGYEDAIYIIVISDNKDIKKVEEQIIYYISSKEENNVCSCEVMSKPFPNSKIIFYKTSFTHRLGTIPMYIGVCDLYYEKNTNMKFALLGSSIIQVCYFMYGIENIKNNYLKEGQMIYPLSTVKN